MQEEKYALLISVFGSILCSLPVERCGIQRKNWKLYDGFRAEIFSYMLLGVSREMLNLVLLYK